MTKGIFSVPARRSPGAFHKPRGIITHSPQKGEMSIEDVIKLSHDVYPLGRLDKDSRGLIILTNDGRVTDRLLNPAHQHEKEYEVKVDRPLTSQALDHLSNGLTLDDGYVTRKCTVKKRNNFSFSIILTEGKNRQIRRMCEALGYNVVDLRRVRIMNVGLQELPSGKYRVIAGPELKKFLSSLELA